MSEVLQETIIEQPVWGSVPSEKVDECRRLVAERYRERGYVGEGDIEDGMLARSVDPYVNESEYFWTADDKGSVTSTVRMIHPASADTLLPIEKEFSLYDIQRQVLLNQKRTDPKKVVEISALARKKGTKFDGATYEMYKTIWQHAKRHGIVVCAISSDEFLDKLLVEMFGSAIERAGEPAVYLGSTTIPSVLSPDNCAAGMAEIYRSKSGDDAKAYIELIEYFMDGLNVEYFSDEEKRTLRAIGCNI